MRTRKRKTREISYTYYEYDPESKREIRHVLEPGVDGVTEDWIVLLQEMDHAEYLQKRYKEENADYRCQNYKTEVHEGNDKAVDPLEKKVYEEFTHGDPIENPMVDKVRRLIWENLSPDQIDLVYELYGARRQGKDIASEQGVTQQAIDGRNKRIKDKIKKLIEE